MMINSKGHFLPKYAPIEIGERFGLWVVFSKGSFKHNQQRWQVRCDCGAEREVAQQHLRSGKSTRCIKCAGKKITDVAKSRNLGKYAKGGQRSIWIQDVMNRKFDEQNGICPICGKQLPQLSKCAWDHNHETGEGRDLLHRGCNVLLGFIERDSSVLRRVIQYCEKYSIKYSA